MIASVAWETQCSSAVYTEWAVTVPSLSPARRRHLWLPWQNPLSHKKSLQLSLTSVTVAGEQNKDFPLGFANGRQGKRKEKCIVPSLAHQA